MYVATLPTLVAIEIAVVEMFLICHVTSHDQRVV